MRRAIFSVVAATLITVSLWNASAQADDFEGTSLLSMGISGGLAPAYGQSSWPTLHAMYEHFFNEDIAVGSTLAYAQSDFSRLGSPELKLHTLMIGARGSYHFRRFLSTEWLDPYAGASVGYGYVALSAPGGYYSDVASSGSSFFGFHAGANMTVLPRMAVFAEVGNASMNNVLLAQSGMGLTGGVTFHF